MIKNKKYLFLPVETKVRELEAKINIACVAASEGWATVVGEKSQLRRLLPHMPKGVILETTISESISGRLEFAKCIGNVVCALCEEGLCYHDIDFYGKVRFSARSFSSIKYFFAWGNRHASDVKKLSGCDCGKIVVSGNARFDLLSEEMRKVFLIQADQLRSKYGKIILVNTKFGLANLNRDDVSTIDFLRRQGKVNNASDEDYFLKYIEHQKKLLGDFCDAIQSLAQAYTDYTIIVRPHPSENHAVYNNISQNYDNVKVLNEGNVYHWILAADVVIHNNCTTGIEATLLGKPSIEYRPYQNKVYDLSLPSEASYNADSLTELLELIESFIGDLEITSLELGDKQPNLSTLRRYVANMDGHCASQMIVDTINQIDIPVSNSSFPLTDNRYINFVRAMRRPGLMYAIKNFRRSLLVKRRNYKIQQFPSLEIDEVEMVVAKLQNATGGFDGVKVEKVYDNCYCIFGSSND